MNLKKRWFSITICLVLPIALLLSLFPAGLPLLTNVEKAFASGPYQPMVSAGEYHIVGLKSDGTVVTTGRNVEGQCDVSGWSDIQQVSARWLHTIGLKSDGTVIATGYNGDGQCDVSGWSDIQQISAGGFHTAGLKSDGMVVATGYNDYGQCDVSGWSDIQQISAGYYHTAGLESDGTVAATGRNDDGQCDVSGWSDIRQVSAGYNHTVGLESDGTVAATGRNDDGQCDVSGWSNIKQVSAGAHYTVGLKSDGIVVATGNNDYSQCDVSGWSDIKQVSAGAIHTVGLKTDGTVVAAGLEVVLTSWDLDGVQVFVNASATGNNDGTSWANAYTNLREALSNAGTPCQIRVASGTYTPVRQGSAGARTDSFIMKNGIGIYGGFPNTGSPTWNQRDWQTNETILSGEIGNPGTPDNCYHVLYNSGSLDATAILDGFTINGGNANGSGSDSDGGGMYNENSSSRFLNCTFTGNESIDGGAVYNIDSQSIFTNCTFTDNTAISRGGGMYNAQTSVSWQYIGASGTQQQLPLDLQVTGTESINNTNCYVAQNTFAEGISFPVCYESTCFDITLRSITFAQDMIHRDFIQLAINLTVDSLFGLPVKIPINYTYVNRPDLLMVGGTWSFTTVSNVPLLGISEEVVWDAEVVAIEAMTVPIGTFECYRVEATTESGSPVVSWWPIDGNMLCPVKYQLFASGQFPSIFVELIDYPNHSPILTNCTFTDNRASSGGAIYNELGSLPQVTNCILWGDTGEEIHTEAGVCPVMYSDVQGGYTGIGNINGTPMFVNPGSGDFHLLTNSPCIDAGTNSAPYLPAEDFEGDPRISNRIADMGVDEALWSPLNFDVDQNGDISKQEALNAVVDFFAGQITKQQALEVIVLFFS